MKTLAALTIVVMPYNVICGYFGMNVEVPMRDIDSLLPFFMLFVLATVLAAAFFFTLKKMNFA